MAAGVAAEAVLEQGLRVLVVVHAAADGGADEAIVAAVAGGGDVEAADDVLVVVGDVGVAAREEVRARLAEEVLHAVGDEPGGGDGEGEPEPADVELPQLAAPDEAGGRAAGHGAARHEDEADDGDDDGGEADGERDEQPGGHGLVLCEGEAVRGGGGAGRRSRGQPWYVPS